jgi:hypothetical protein
VRQLEEAKAVQLRRWRQMARRQEQLLVAQLESAAVSQEEYDRRLFLLSENWFEMPSSSNVSSSTQVR